MRSLTAAIGADCGAAGTGCSLGAYHAANFALKRADLFPRGLCLSGSYDPGAWGAWGDRGEAAGRVDGRGSPCAQS